MLKATKHKNGIISLDGKICPFRQPVLLPSQLGGIDVQHLPCDSTCTHFHHISEDGNHTVIVSCGTGVNLPVELTNKLSIV
jgi:hypothetical protein